MIQVSISASHFNDMNAELVMLTECHYIGPDLIDIIFSDWNNSDLPLDEFIKDYNLWNSILIRVSEGPVKANTMDEEVGYITNAMLMAQNHILPMLCKALEGRKFKTYCGYHPGSRLIIYNFE